MNIIPDLPNEKWATIPNTQYKYLASNKGRVKAISCTDDQGKLHEVKLLKPWLAANGYPQVELSRLANRPRHLVQSLILEAFLEKKDSKLFRIIHKDGDPENNDLENLEYRQRKSRIAKSKQIQLDLF